MQTYGNPDVTYGWWAGNSVVTNRSGRFISSHVGHTGLICLAAGGSTLWEFARYDPSVPMGHQSSLFLAHLASIGIEGSKRASSQRVLPPAAKQINPVCPTWEAMNRPERLVTTELPAHHP